MSILPLKNSGFTLVEVMVAIVILMVGLLALLQSVNVSISQNLANALRDEAVSITERKVNEAKRMSFDSLTSANYTVIRPVRSTTKSYAVFKTISSFSTSKKIRIRVEWTYKGSQYRHQLTTMRSQ